MVVMCHMCLFEDHFSSFPLFAGSHLYITSTWNHKRQRCCSCSTTIYRLNIDQDSLYTWSMDRQY